jgi:hypothetical protein
MVPPRGKAGAGGFFSPFRESEYFLSTILGMEVMRRHLTASTKSVLKAAASFEASLEGET